ncbi:MAG: serine protease [Desulfobacterales bacterium]|nr:MAG: serine protease [Desulfobacterales bacterium]
MNVRFRHLTVAFTIIVLLSAFVVFNHSGMVKASGQKVYIIPLSGTVDPGMAAFTKRVLHDQKDDANSLFIFELDTFGGRVDSALQIVDLLISVPKGKTIAYVKTKAISAGALIALACSRIVMKKNTTIGDCAPITYSNEGPKMLGEKFQSPLRAKFRALAKRNGYPEALAESMVTAEMAVYAVNMDGNIRYMDSQAFDDLSASEKDKVTAKKTVVAKGELLTMNDSEALELGFSSTSVDSIEDLLKETAIKGHETIRIDESWSESLVRFIGSISPYLLMIGLAALYTEIKAPGFGLPGIIGITCLALVFLSQYMVGLADYTELLLLTLGIILLGFEIFVIPGFGVAGISGILLIAVSAVLALQDFVIPDPSFPWQGELLVKNIMHVVGAFFVAIITALLILRYILPRLSLVTEGPYLATTLKDSHADSVEAKGAKVGDKGTAMTFLRPSGKAKIKDAFFDVITEGEFIEKGTTIIISEIKGNRIIVSRGPDDE